MPRAGTGRSPLKDKLDETNAIRLRDGCAAPVMVPFDAIPLITPVGR
jgi:hypothetical protein